MRTAVVMSWSGGKDSVMALHELLRTADYEVVELMAQGRSNGAISRQLYLTLKTVEGHIASIFTKLELHSEPDDNRRVLAVLGWLESS